ncbi:MAG: repeat containing protein [Betaproteobacteria bacterium]|nr:repeat containing protein [Betaproteobacteria bacterium]
MVTQPPIAAIEIAASPEKPPHAASQRTRILATLIALAGGMAIGVELAHSATMLQPDLAIEKIGQIPEGPPAQMVFGPDGRLYVSLANFNADAASAVSFAYNPIAALSNERVAATTGGALGIAFGPVSTGVAGDPGVATTTAMYLTDTARNGVSNLRVLTPDSAGFYGGAGSVNTPIVTNIAAGYHQANQLVVTGNSDGSSSLYVGIGVRTPDGVSGYPNAGNGRDTAYGGTISTIRDLRQVNGAVADSAGFGMTGNASTNNQPDFSNSGPYTSTAQNKLVVQSSGTRNPFGIGLDATGNIWFTNNFNRSQSNGTFDGTIDPATKVLKGFTIGDPAPGPNLRNNVYDQFFRAIVKGDYGYNNINWRDDAAHTNTEVKTRAAVDAGFFSPAKLVRSTTFDNLSRPPGGFALYDQSDINHILGLGPSSSSDGFAFYTADAFPAEYRGKAFIARWSPSVMDAEGNLIDYADIIAVDPVTGIARRIALGFANPIDVLEDGFGNLLVADYGDGTIWRISAFAVPEPGVYALLPAGGLFLMIVARRRRSSAR